MWKNDEMLSHIIKMSAVDPSNTDPAFNPSEASDVLKEMNAARPENQIETPGVETLSKKKFIPTITKENDFTLDDEDDDFTPLKTKRSSIKKVAKAKKIDLTGSGKEGDPLLKEEKPDVTHAELNAHLMRLDKRFGRMQGNKYRTKTIHKDLYNKDVKDIDEEAEDE